jgi:hypothetical protein
MDDSSPHEKIPWTSTLGMRAIKKIDLRRRGTMRSLAARAGGGMFASEKIREIP